MRMILSVLFALLTIPSAAQSDDCDPQASSALGEVATFTAESLKAAQLAEFDQGVSNFCQRNELLRYIHVNPSLLPKKNYDHADLKALREAANQIVAETISLNGSAWGFSLVPTRESLERSAQNVFRWVLMGLERSSPNEKLAGQKTALREYLATASLPSEADYKRIAGNLAVLQANDGEGYSRLKNFEILALCAQTSLLEAQECAKGIGFIAQDLGPKKVSGIAQMINLPAWKRLLLEPKYQEGLRSAGLAILARMDNDTDPASNAFDELKSSFLKSGLSDAEAEDASFDTLAVISTGGANTCERITGVTNPTLTATGTALCAISVALNTLDLTRSEQGLRPYSYPRTVQTQCLYPKPYFFWMSASLARTLVKDYGLSPKGAMVAAFVAQKGYQLNRDAGGNGPIGRLSAIFNKPAYDPVDQVIRMDLAFTAAGSRFGAEFGGKSEPRLNVDIALRKLIQDADVLSPKSNEDATSMSTLASVRRWDRLFSPNSALKVIRAQE